MRTTEEGWPINPWWGDPWPTADQRAPVCEDDEDRIPTPVGEPCMWCEHTIEAGDQGTSMYLMSMDGPPKLLHGHKECMLRNVMGCSARWQGQPCDHTGDYRADALKLQHLMQERWATEPVVLYQRGDHEELPTDGSL